MEFRTRMQTNRPVLLDGGFGSELIKRGLNPGGINCLTNPDAVLAVHQEYAASGSEVLLTNTLTMNAIYAKAHNLDVDVAAANRAGAQLARQAAPPGVFVLGDMSSTGQMLQPYGTYTEEDFHAAFAEQAEVLVDHGVDGLLVETMFDLREALCALKACKAVTDLPVVVSLTLSTAAHGGRTVMGDTTTQIGEAVTSEGADAVGINCGDLSPDEIAVVVGELKAWTSLPILVQPNAGKPSLADDVTVYDMPPDAFAAGLKKCLDAGAHLVGGCCGTTPDHIRALAVLLQEQATHSG